MLHLTELAEVVALVCWLCSRLVGAAVWGEADGGVGLTTSAVATCTKMQFLVTCIQNGLYMLHLTKLAEVVALVCWLCGRLVGAAVMAGGEADGGLEMTSSAVVTCCKMQYQSHIPSAVFFLQLLLFCRLATARGFV